MDTGASYNIVLYARQLLYYRHFFFFFVVFFLLWLGAGGRAYVRLPDRKSVCCVSLCLRRSTLRWKARPHKSHANGLYPVCFRLCVIRFDDWLKALPHTWHLCGFSPVNRITNDETKITNIQYYTILVIKHFIQLVSLSPCFHIKPIT